MSILASGERPCFLSGELSGIGYKRESGRFTNIGKGLGSTLIGSGFEVGVTRLFFRTGFSLFNLFRFYILLSANISSSLLKLKFSVFYPRVIFGVTSIIAPSLVYVLRGFRLTSLFSIIDRDLDEGIGKLISSS